MKKGHCLLFLLLLLSLRLPAQFTLSGKIPQYDGKSPVEINTPVVYGFYKENTVNVPVSETGRFNILLPVKGRKFVTLIFKRQFYTLLLTEGKDLQVELDDGLKLLSGKALPENELLRKMNVDVPPFFIGNDSFNGLPVEALKEKVIRPFFALQDERFKTIETSGLSVHDKKLIASEMKYLGYNYLSDFGRTQIADKETINGFIIEVFDPCVIAPEFVPAGPQYYAFADNYLRYLETKAFTKIRKENIPSSEPIPYYGISLDSADALIQKHGKSFWRWVGSLRNFPPDVAETYNFQQIKSQYYDGDIDQAGGLAAAFRERFPQSRYNKEISRMVGELQSKLLSNRNNKNITVINDYHKLRSIYEVINPLKGKVVYLDIWGTWCGPCKEEIKHLPGLHSAFAGKDVAFVYLDMDDDHRDALWKDFIKVNGMEGFHFRKNRKTIAPFWKELLADTADKAEYYPQYFLFDKTGKLVVSKAKRPSEGRALYEQINAILDQGN
jgi:thiol-disulfide isomerase/thioredoxin